MSEYWKSTPKYWCKFCLIYVKDTKLERANHEATGRHQGNIQRSLKNLHREQTAIERQKQQAKNEVARLNGLVPGPGASSSTTPGATPTPSNARVGAAPTYTKQIPKQATLEDRKAQVAQLAAMGVTMAAMPDTMRADLAIPGEWQVVSQKVIGEDGKEVKDVKALSTGVRKRKVDEEEEERIAEGQMITKKKGWGNTYKRFPGKMGGDEDDLEALFAKKPVVKQEDGGEAHVKTESPEVKGEPEVKPEPGVKEQDTTTALADIPTKEEAAKQEAAPPAPAVVFKKRKKIAR